jgi:hypothetical protein
MTGKKLGDKDRHAVDLFLDRPDESDPDPRSESGVFIPPGSIELERMKSLEKILSLLDELPVSDPPADLAKRTIRRIAKAGAAATPPPVQPTTGQRPHA